MSGVCGWCQEPITRLFHCGRLKAWCGCLRDYRTPIEKRRDAVLNKYGDDPAAYTPSVLAKLAQDGLFDIAAHFCPSGKLTMAETKAREARQLR